MDLEKVKFDAIRFFGSGMKRHWFTKNLYEAFHCYSNKFIAHTNIEGFYKARFGTAEALRETARMLDTKGNEVLTILRDTFYQYADKVKQVAESKELSEIAQELDNLITKSYFIGSIHYETRTKIREALVNTLNLVEELQMFERE